MEIQHIKIGGETRPLYFSVNALIEFEELTGIDITDSESRANLTKMKNIRALAFAALKHGHKKANGVFPDFTVDMVGDWMTKKVINQIGDAFIKSSGGEDDGEEDESDKKKLDGATSDVSRSAA